MALFKEHSAQHHELVKPRAMGQSEADITGFWWDEHDATIKNSMRQWGVSLSIAHSPAPSLCTILTEGSRGTLCTQHYKTFDIRSNQGATLYVMLMTTANSGCQLLHSGSQRVCRPGQAKWLASQQSGRHVDSQFADLPTTMLAQVGRDVCQATTLQPWLPSPPSHQHYSGVCMLVKQ